MKYKWILITSGVILLIVVIGFIWKTQSDKKDAATLASGGTVVKNGQRYILQNGVVTPVGRNVYGCSEGTSLVSSNGGSTWTTISGPCKPGSVSV